MGIKATIIKPYAKRISKTIAKWSKNPVDSQATMIKLLINRAALTQFGQSHYFHKIVTYHNFKEQIPICDGASFKPYIDLILSGEKDVVWPGKPKYLVKQVGKSFNDELFPVTREILPSFFNTVRNAVFQYALQRDDLKFVEGKVVYLPSAERLSSSTIPQSTLSGIVNQHIPTWMTGSQIPDVKVRHMIDRSKRLSKIVGQSKDKNVTIIGGGYELLKGYAEQILKEKHIESLKQLFPGLRLFVTGADFDGHQKTEMQQILGDGVDIMSTLILPCGFIGFQDNMKQNGLLLNVNSGIYFEFIPLDADNTERLWLDQISLNVPYKLVVSNNAGLWGYDTGVVVEFVNLTPHRIRVVS